MNFSGVRPLDGGYCILYLNNFRVIMNCLDEGPYTLQQIHGLKMTVPALIIHFQAVQRSRCTAYLRRGIIIQVHFLI